MKPARLLRLIGDVDPQLVDLALIEACPPRKAPNKWIKWVSLAACLALVVCGIGRYVYFYIDQQSILYPNENTPCNPSSSTGNLQFSNTGVQKPYTYAAMAAAADIVMVADVISVEAGDNILCCRNYAYVAVRDILKGEVSLASTLCVADPTSDYYSNLRQDPMMQSGNRVLLFLLKSETTHFTSQNKEFVVYQFVNEYPCVGKFFYDRDGKYHNVHTYGDYPDFFFKEVYVDNEPKTLEEIKNLICSV